MWRCGRSPTNGVTQPRRTGRGEALASIRSFGESALLLDLADAPSRDVARRVHAAAAVLEAANPEGLRNVTPGLTTLLVEFDPLAVDRPVLEVAVAHAAEAATVPSDRPAARRRTIPVVYGGEFGPDLDDVARLTGLTVAQVAERHAASVLEVYLLGFSPGFAYMGDLPPELKVPRLATPRTTTPAGAVAITGRYSGIYPIAAPGGWRVIGRTPLRLFDVTRTPPTYLLPGDEVRLTVIGPDVLSGSTLVLEDW